MLFAAAARPTQDPMTTHKIMKALAVSSLNNLKMWLQESHKQNEQANSHPLPGDSDWCFDAMAVTPEKFSVSIIENGEGMGEVMTKDQALTMLETFKESVFEHLDEQLAYALLC